MSELCNEGSARPKVSVVVPCLNEETTIERMLDGLAAQTFPASDLEVLIVDGFSEDATRGRIDSWSKRHEFPKVRVIENPDRKIPQGLNRGFDAANGSIFLRMDAHSVPAKDYVARCVEHLEAKRADNVGGLWEIQPSVSTSAAASIALAAAHPLGSGGASYRSGGEAGAVDTVPFGCFRRQTWEKVGPFDTSLLANEDYEWNCRLRREGGTVYFDPLIRCVYFSRPNYRRLASQYQNYGYWKGRMLKRNPESLKLRQILPPLLVAALIGTFMVSVAAAFVFNLLFLFAAPLLFAAYLSALSVGTRKIASRDNGCVLWAGAVLAIACMHLFWGFGFFRGLLARGG